MLPVWGQFGSTARIRLFPTTHCEYVQPSAITAQTCSRLARVSRFTVSELSTSAVVLLIPLSLLGHLSPNGVAISRLAVAFSESGKTVDTAPISLLVNDDATTFCSPRIIAW